MMTMQPNGRTCGRSGLLGAVAALVIGCGGPNEPEGSSRFTAEVRGSQQESLTGQAVVVGSDDNSQRILDVEVPGVGSFAGVYLATGDRKRVLTLFRPGTGLPSGTYKVALWTAPPLTTPDLYSGSYVVRQVGGAQTFVADSGTVTITQTGVRVAGTFRLYVDRYDVYSLEPTTSNSPRAPTESGRAPMVISGSFDATRSTR